MARQRGYLSSCGISHALDLVGERWALPIVRELLHGPRRYSDLRRELPSASPNAISDRLRELTESGVLRRRRLPAPAASWVYELTDWGAELDSIVVSLGDWGVRSGSIDPSLELSRGSVMLTFRTYYSGDGSGSITVDLIDDAGAQQFGIRLGHGRAVTSNEAPAEPDAVVTGTARALIDAIGSDDFGAVDVDGDTELALDLIAHTHISTPAPASARR